mmetsp:Transcript_6276/g.4472  ORF Transcript_6276/g.4472 Transcript_6276/m.4472 type:complete len:92 (+) Transcript_6276:904-1179(+)
MKVNTKPCPQCKTPIEKNQGCMYMACTNCKHGFCWLCMKPSNHHDMCNGYEMIVRNAGITATTFKGALAIERDLKKFEYFSTRYMEHGKSI